MDETCGDYTCQTCYPGGVIFVEPEAEALVMAKLYEM